MARLELVDGVDYLFNERIVFSTIRESTVLPSWEGFLTNELCFLQFVSLLFNIYFSC